MHVYLIVLSNYLVNYLVATASLTNTIADKVSRAFVQTSFGPRSGKLRTDTIMVLLLVSQNPIHFSRKEVLKAIKPVAII